MIQGQTSSLNISSSIMELVRTRKRPNNEV